MPPLDATAALFEQFAKLTPANQLRLAAELIDQGQRVHIELAGTIARRVADEITTAMLLAGHDRKV